jgi:hypothetical protein
MLAKSSFPTGSLGIRTLPLALCAAVLTAGASTTVIAQELSRGASILDRPKPELDPLGIRAGGFLVFPKLELGTTYDDNVFATENDEQSDFLFQVLPSVQVNSDFSRHQLNFSAGADVGRFADLTSENYIDYFVTGNGRLDFAGDAMVLADLSHRKLHEERGSADFPDEGQGDPDALDAASEPIDFTRSSAALAYQQRLNRITYRVGIGADNVDYDDVSTVGGGELDQDDRDRWSYSATGRIGYDLAPGYQPFLRLIYTRTEYDEGIVKPDSDTYEAEAGAAFDLTNLLTGEIFVGYQSRKYDEREFGTSSGPAYGLSLDYAYTQLTSFSAGISTAFEEGYSTNPTPRERTTAQIGVDHELLRNLILSARALYQTDDYETSPREEDFYSLQAGATYTVNRNLYLRGTYTYSSRDSNVQGDDYDRNLVLLRIGAQL